MDFVCANVLHSQMNDAMEERSASSRVASWRPGVFDECNSSNEWISKGVCRAVAPRFGISKRAMG